MLSCGAWAGVYMLLESFPAEVYFERFEMEHLPSNKVSSRWDETTCAFADGSSGSRFNRCWWLGDTNNDKRMISSLSISLDF